MTENHKKIENAKNQNVADFSVIVSSESSTNVFEEIAGRSCTSSQCSGDQCYWGTE